jgi:hypothetical protein
LYVQGHNSWPSWESNLRRSGRLSMNDSPDRSKVACFHFRSVGGTHFS